jgi:exportin-2 (importin alpha re-exporter)
LAHNRWEKIAIVTFSFVIRTPAFVALRHLLEHTQELKKDTEEDPDAGLTAIDYEEQTVGYQAAYSRLAASESVSVDPVAYVRDPRELLETELVKLGRESGLGGQLNQMISAAQAQGV